jgi:heme-degrading monooxygenase HmoA
MEETMIARMWHGYATPENADAYEAMLKPELLPGLSKMPGFLGSYLLRRPSGDEVEFITIILWESYEALKTVAGENYQIAIVPEERRRYLKRYDSRAEHYDVQSTHFLSGTSPNE